MQVEAMADGPAPARLLDLTRLVSRAGRPIPTGIDRVEAMYLVNLLNDATPLFGLVRTGIGSVLLDRAGMQMIADRVFGRAQWGPPDLIARLFRKIDPAQRAAQTDLRRHAIARVGRNKPMADMFRRHLPEGTVWISVGHANLFDRCFEAIHAVPGGRAAVLIHDVIALDTPDFHSAPTRASFEARLRRVSAHADQVIYISQVARDTAERWLADMGRVPPGMVAHLGIDLPVPDAAQIPETIDRKTPYFVVLGTIEPRKNHALLLDIWDHFAATLPPEDIPNLFIIGARGWLNEDVFARLDTSPLMNRHVFELNNLPDGPMAAMVQGARALLMPSLAEGFGLPPAEALGLGTPVILNPLPVYREFLGNKPIYADVSDMYSWATKIAELSQAEETGQQTTRVSGVRLPTWQDHFNLVLRVI